MARQDSEKGNRMNAIGNMGRVATVAALAALLAACGGKPGGEPAAGAKDKDMGETVDELDEAAAESAGGMQCPPKARKELAGPDIVGLKLGMRYDEALATARCALGANAVVNEEKRWFDDLDTQGVELGPQTFTIMQGRFRPCDYAREWQECDGKYKWEHRDEAINVAAPGAPGKEQVVAIWRSQYFPEGKRPTVDATLAALKGKYGEPQVMTENADSGNALHAGSWDLVWVRALDGAPMTEPNPLFHACQYGISGKADGSFHASWREGCGLNIRAEVYRSRGNPALAGELHVSMMNQDALARHKRATEDELRRVGDARRAEEVQQAGGSGDVKL